MIFVATGLKDAHIIEIEKLADKRGFFARSWCQKEFETHGLVSTMVQANFSYNKSKGTLRGMHYQRAPYEEVKLVRCTRGSIYDVIIDMRPDSPTYKQWLGVELTADGDRMFYVPGGFAHGFLTLEDDTQVCYQMSTFYVPEASRGVRWNDPRFGVEWLSEPAVISERDRSYSDFDPAKFDG